MNKSQNVISLSVLRLKLDLINEEILFGLKHRTRYPLNKEIYSEEFAEGKTWFLYRLKKVQDIDSEYGRYLYNDQTPFIYSKKDLAQPKTKSVVNNNGTTPIQIDLSNEIISAYQKVISEICIPGEDKSTYGETTKIDVENILAINERIVSLGEQVAGYKIQENPSLLKTKDKKEIEEKLISATREKEVIEKTIERAKALEINNLSAIKEFVSEIVRLTKKIETEYIIHTQKKEKD
jgi:chorismate mutase